ncbi:MAG: hypothetical protein ABIY90_07025 [Puia sp.]
MIQYTGSVDFSRSDKPRFRNPGTCISLKCSGLSCRVLVNDDVIDGTREIKCIANSITCCGGHPTVVEHQKIAAELTAYIKKLMGSNPDSRVGSI